MEKKRSEESLHRNTIACVHHVWTVARSEWIRFCFAILYFVKKQDTLQSAALEEREYLDSPHESTWAVQWEVKRIRKVLLRTQSGSGSCCCSPPGRVPACSAWWFRMQYLLWSHFTGGFWKSFGKKIRVLEAEFWKKNKNLPRNWHIPQNVPYACLCFSLPQKAWYIYSKVKLTNSGVFFHVGSTHRL